MDPLLQLKKLVEGIHPLTDDDWNAFAAIWTPGRARRKEMLTLAGEKENYLYFVMEGVQRVVYLDDQGREATLVFTYAPSFGGVLDALLLQTPSRYGYETLTASAFLRTSYAQLMTVMQRPAIDAMIGKGITLALSGVLERLAELQCFSSEEKFRKLLTRSPHVLKLIPHKYLASYIGIDASNFSKLINSVRL